MSYRSGRRVVRKAKWELLATAELEFDVLITVDTNLRYRQNMEGRNIVIVVLHSSCNRLERLRQYFPACGKELRKQIEKVEKTAH